MSTYDLEAHHHSREHEEELPDPTTMDGLWRPFATKQRTGAPSFEWRSPGIEVGS